MLYVIIHFIHAEQIFRSNNQGIPVHSISTYMYPESILVKQT